MSVEVIDANSKFLPNMHEHLQAVSHLSIENRYQATKRHKDIQRREASYSPSQQIRSITVIICYKSIVRTHQEEEEEASAQSLL